MVCVEELRVVGWPLRLHCFPSQNVRVGLSGCQMLVGRSACLVCYTTQCGLVRARSSLIKHLCTSRAACFTGTMPLSALTPWPCCENEVVASRRCARMNSLHFAHPNSYHTVTIQLPYSYHTVTIQLPLGKRRVFRASEWRKVWVREKGFSDRTDVRKCYVFQMVTVW